MSPSCWSIKRPSSTTASRRRSGSGASTVPRCIAWMTAQPLTGAVLMAHGLTPILTGDYASQLIRLTRN